MFPSLDFGLYFKSFFLNFFKGWLFLGELFYDRLQSIFHQQIQITNIYFLPPWGFEPQSLDAVWIGSRWSIHQTTTPHFFTLYSKSQNSIEDLNFRDAKFLLPCKYFLLRNEKDLTWDSGFWLGPITPVCSTFLFFNLPHFIFVVYYYQLCKLI